MKNGLKNLRYKIFIYVLIFAFGSNLALPPNVGAQTATVLDLPIPGTMINLTKGYTPTIIRGITMHPDNLLEFDFIVDTGDTGIQGDELKAESNKLIKYFLAGLTVPEKELWVNLSPYEKDRIIPDTFGNTEMGRDLLAQDYMLKQLSSSLMYPEKELGQEFWDRVYKKAQEKYGTTEIPMNTFNKIWIVPEKAIIYEHGQSAFVIYNKLKVMLEEDYVALQKNMGNEKMGMEGLMDKDTKVISGVTSAVVKEVLIPEIEKEVNEGKTFANLRQVANSMVLAIWYKKNLKESLLGKVYVDKKKIAGIDVADKEIKEKIFDQYVESFKKGVFDYMREDFDPLTQQIIPRKYFSGGEDWAMYANVVKTVKDLDFASLTKSEQNAALKNLGGRLKQVNIKLYEHQKAGTDLPEGGFYVRKSIDTRNPVAYSVGGKDYVIQPKEVISTNLVVLETRGFDAKGNPETLEGYVSTEFYRTCIENLNLKENEVEAFNNEFEILQQQLRHNSEARDVFGLFSGAASNNILDKLISEKNKKYMPVIFEGAGIFDEIEKAQVPITTLRNIGNQPTNIFNDLKFSNKVILEFKIKNNIVNAVVFNTREDFRKVINALPLNIAMDMLSELSQKTGVDLPSINADGDIDKILDKNPAETLPLSSGITSKIKNVVLGLSGNKPSNYVHFYDALVAAHKKVDNEEKYYHTLRHSYITGEDAFSYGDAKGLDESYKKLLLITGYFHDVDLNRGQNNRASVIDTVEYIRQFMKGKKIDPVVDSILRSFNLNESELYMLTLLIQGTEFPFVDDKENTMLNPWYNKQEIPTTPVQEYLKTLHNWIGTDGFNLKDFEFVMKMAPIFSNYFDMAGYYMRGNRSLVLNSVRGLVNEFKAEGIGAKTYTMLQGTYSFLNGIGSPNSLAPYVSLCKKILEDSDLQNKIKGAGKNVPTYINDFIDNMREEYHMNNVFEFLPEEFTNNFYAVSKGFEEMNKAVQKGVLNIDYLLQIFSYYYDQSLKKNAEIIDLNKSSREKPQDNTTQNKKAVSKDAAMKTADQATVAKNKKYGGIDFDPAMLDLQIKRDGGGVPLPVWDQPIDKMNIEGFIPVIINVTPANLNLPIFSKLKAEKAGNSA